MWSIFNSLGSKSICIIIPISIQQNLLKNSNLYQTVLKEAGDTKYQYNYMKNVTAFQVGLNVVT